MKKHQLISHRGASAIACENTVGALELAVALGALWVEFDVQITRDSQLVVYHDHNIERLTGNRGVIADYTYIELSQMPLCSNQHYRIPLLDDYLDKAIALGIGINLEVKAFKNQHIVISKLLLQYQTKLAKFDSQCLVSSGDIRVLAYLRQQQFEAQLGLVASKLTKNILKYASDLQLSVLSLDARYLTKKHIISCHDANLLIFAYTINTIQDVKRQFSIGVDAIFSDIVFPSSLQL